MSKRQKNPPMQRRLLPAPQVDRSNAQIEIAQAKRIAELQAEVERLKRNQARQQTAIEHLAENGLASTQLWGALMFVAGAVETKERAANIALTFSAKALSDSYLALDLAVRRANLPPISEEVRTMVYKVIDALQEYLSGSDKGEKLKVAIDDVMPGMTEYMADLPTLKKRGPKNGQRAIGELLSEIVYQRRQQPGHEDEDRALTAAFVEKVLEGRSDNLGKEARITFATYTDKLNAVSLLHREAKKRHRA